jgi:hypothetical protein
MSGAQNWYVKDPYGIDVQASARTPEASYPDGYLSTVDGRRSGKGDVAVPPLNERTSFERGVNKYTKLPPDRYFFPPNFNLMSRLEAPVHADAQGLPAVERQAIQGTLAERITSNFMPTRWSSDLRVYTDRPPFR